MVSPHLFLSANGYRDRVDSLCSCNELLVASTLLSLTHRGKQSYRWEIVWTTSQVMVFNLRRKFPFYYTTFIRQLQKTITLKTFLRFYTQTISWPYKYEVLLFIKHSKQYIKTTARCNIYLLLSCYCVSNNNVIIW